LAVVSALWLLLVIGTAPARAQESDANARVVELERTLQELEERLDAMEEERAQAGTFRAYWNEGLRLDTADGAFKLKIGGRIQNDWAFFEQDRRLENQIGNMQDGTEFRRAWLYISGTVYDRVEFKVQYDFSGGETDFKDVYLGLNRLPVVGNVRVGHFKEPFSLEELTSSKYTTFMERALPNGLAPSWNTGIMFQDQELDERMTWAVGLFRDADSDGDGSGDGEYNVTARVTGLAVYEDEGSKLAHFGIAYSHRNLDDDLRFRARPESHLAEELVDTGEFDADNMDLLGLETAMVYGPGSIQAEYVQAMVDGDNRTDPDFSGYYVEASYFLTGEHRNYKRSDGSFDRLRPKNNFLGKDGGLGAWQVAARYSHIDLSDSGIRGGELDTVAAGLNWYLNPNTRVTWNYVFADPSDRYSGEANIFQMRFQIDF
jgi:phosphate-selective porin OprO/OprP